MLLAPRPPLTKRGVTVKTVDKWITESDKEISTSAWLKVREGGSLVRDDRCLTSLLIRREAARNAQLQPSVCRWFQEPVSV